MNNTSSHPCSALRNPVAGVPLPGTAAVRRIAIACRGPGKRCA